MAQIIQHGSEWLHKKEGWYGKTVKCTRCECRFVLDQNVNFEVRTGGGTGISYIQCSECGSTNGVTVEKA
jgi:hypothetical protein